MRGVHSLAAGFLAISLAAPLQAQSGSPSAGPGSAPAGNGEVKGAILDSRGDTPVDRASVAIRSKRDSSLVTGALAGPDGKFRIQGLRPGAYFARVTAIGFGPKFVDFAVTPAAPAADLGAIRLTPVAVELSGITVTEQRDAVAVEPDRNAYRAKDVAPAAANASDVLDAVPSVQVDGDGKVSLRGNENVAVQINGRPSPIRGPQLGSYLKSLPANIVERVEVIPNPSAKYDPEGMAGIINIVLKENTDLGVSAGLNVGVSRLDRYNTSGNIGYQAGRLTTFTSVGLNQDARAIVGINDRERYDALRALTSVTAQDVSSEVDNGRQNFTTSVDYRLTNRDLFSNSITLNRRTGIDESVAAYTELDGSRSMTDRYDRPRNADTRGYLIDYTSALKRTITQRKHEIGGELRYTQSRDDDITTLWRQPAAGSGGSIVELERQSTDALTSTFNAQLDYLRPLGKNGKLETGYKGTIRLLDRDYLVQKDPAGSGTWTTSGLSNDFEFDETVNAVYGVASNRAGKFDLQGGLRAEYASREFSLSTSRYPYSYTSLFPSGVVMYNLSAQNQLKASYSRRIRRPGTQELNPFPSFFDVQTVFMGNPALNPEYTDAIELGYVRNMKLGTFQFSPFFRHTSDVIRVDINTADVVDGREVTSVSFKNLDKSDSWGADINGSLRLGPKFSGFASFNVFKMVTDGGSQSALSSDAVAWSGRVNGTTQLNKTLTMQASYFYRAPMKIEKGTFAAQHMAFFSFRQKVNGEKAAITLRINDPFGTGAFKIKAGDDNVIQITERDFGSRMVFLGFQYTYGQTPRVREPRPQEQQEGGVRFQ